MTLSAFTCSDWTHDTSLLGGLVSGTVRLLPSEVFCQFENKQETANNLLSIEFRLDNGGLCRGCVASAILLA